MIALFLTAIISACNSDSDTIVTENDFGNCSVTSFSLAEDDSVLSGLDSVYFSIDLVNAEIFNADSLPKGTKIDKLLVEIGTSSASGCDLTFRLPGTSRDTTISYLESPNDSINFADGPVKLLITSYDGLSKYEYTIKVNVHQVVPDTLYWDQMARRDLPGTLAAPQLQKTVEFGGKVYCLTSDGEKASIAVSDNLFENDWSAADVTLPVGADVESFVASTEAMYILDENGNIYTSVDAQEWTPTGSRMDYVYGGYTDHLLGAVKTADGWKHVTYPATVEKTVPTGCPVAGTSNLVAYQTKWSATPLAMFVGGRDASGNVVGSTWGYDGETWAKISNRDIDEREGVTLFPYFTPRVNESTWRVNERTVMIAMGGRYEAADGAVVSNLVYVSYDTGITWEEASDYLQLPSFMPEFASAQAIVINTTLDESTPRSAVQPDGWMPMTGNRLPVWATPVPFKATASRVIKPVTEWECPYIYLFGGVDAAGDLHNSLWKGVIRRFTFAPLY